MTYPNYYPKFHCIADRCRHSCCIGWEIDVDHETLEKYREIPWIVEQIREGSFLLDRQERCPFLNKKGLCNIITELGEEALCQICADHPRFRNFYSDGAEVGLGLCCEAAAELILSQKEPMTLSLYEGTCLPEEREFFLFRQQIFDLLQDRSLSIDARLEKLTGGIVFDPIQWIPLYRSLERLDPAWDTLLSGLEPSAERDPVALEQLAVYFVYRHLAGGLEDGRFRERILFAALSAQLIRALPCPLAEAARMYSAEIEYSAENLDAVFNAFV